MKKILLILTLLLTNLFSKQTTDYNEIFCTGSYKLATLYAKGETFKGEKYEQDIDIAFHKYLDVKKERCENYPEYKKATKIINDIITNIWIYNYDDSGMYGYAEALHQVNYSNSNAKLSFYLNLGQDSWKYHINQLYFRFILESKLSEKIVKLHKILIQETKYSSYKSIVDFKDCKDCIKYSKGKGSDISTYYTKLPKTKFTSNLLTQIMNANSVRITYTNSYNRSHQVDFKTIRFSEVIGKLNKKSKQHRLNK